MMKSPTGSDTIKLPRRLLNARDISLEGLFTEADTAKTEITHEAARATAGEATTNDPRFEFRGAIRLDDH